MNKFIIPLIVILIVLGIFLFLGSESSAPEIQPNENSETSTERMEIPFEGELFVLSAEESLINWEGRKTLVANYADRGTLNFAGGQFYVEEDMLNGGRAVFDMNSINAVSTGALGNEEGLDKHLKSDDFFAVETYPTAELLITGVEELEGENQFNLSGEMTIKGISQGVSFPAVIAVEDGMLTLTGETELDRTLWDIRFGSDKFFDNLADNVIDDFFTVEFNVVAKAE